MMGANLVDRAVSMPGCIFANIFNRGFAGKYLSNDNNKCWIYIDSVVENLETGEVVFSVLDCDKWPTRSRVYPTSYEQAETYSMTYAELLSDGWFSYTGNKLSDKEFVVCSSKEYWKGGKVISRKEWFAMTKGRA